MTRYAPHISAAGSRVSSFFRRTQFALSRFVALRGFVWVVKIEASLLQIQIMNRRTLRRNFEPKATRVASVQILTDMRGALADVLSLS